MDIFKLKNMAITTEITPELAHQFCMTMSDLESRRVKNVRLDINSPGGCLDSGMAIAQRMKISPIRVTTYNLSQAASSGLIIFCAGYRRYSSPFATFLLHEIIANAPEDRVSNIRVVLNQLDVDVDRMISAISHYTGITKEKLKNLVAARHDFNFDSKRALELGFIHGIK